MRITAAQKKADAAAGLIRVSIYRRTPDSYCSYGYTNPQGGGFGSSISSPSLRAAEAKATQHFPPGTTYRLIINGQDKGLKSTPTNENQAEPAQHQAAPTEKVPVGESEATAT